MYFVVMVRFLISTQPQTTTEEDKKKLKEISKRRYVSFDYTIPDQCSFFQNIFAPNTSSTSRDYINRFGIAALYNWDENAIMKTLISFQLYISNHIVVFFVRILETMAIQQSLVALLWRHTLLSHPFEFSTFMHDMYIFWWWLLK